MDSIELIESIGRGDHDNKLTQIAHAVAQRKQFLAISAGHQLQPGDRVKYIAGRPRYLIGAIGKVHRVLNTYVEVILEIGVGKFSAGVPIRTPSAAMARHESRDSAIVRESGRLLKENNEMREHIGRLQARINELETPAEIEPKTQVGVIPQPLTEEQRKLLYQVVYGAQDTVQRGPDALYQLEQVPNKKYHELLAILSGDE